MIAPIRNGRYEFRFSQAGLEVWPTDVPTDPINFFHITTPGLYAVYGTKPENLVIMPLDK